MLSLPESAFIALVTGGSLGIGDIEEAAACAIGQGAYPVIVAGLNKKREVHLSRTFSDPTKARVLGWTYSLPTYLRAANCLIQNAGGVICLEALDIGLPLILYRPVPGHGKANATVMDRTGVAMVVNSPLRLQELINGAVNGTRLLKNPAGEPEVSFLDVVLVALDDPHASTWSFPLPKGQDKCSS